MKRAVDIPLAYVGLLGVDIDLEIEIVGDKPIVGRVARRRDL